MGDMRRRAPEKGGLDFFEKDDLKMRGWDDFYSGSQSGPPPGGLQDFAEDNSNVKKIAIGGAALVFILLLLAFTMSSGKQTAEPAAHANTASGNDPHQFKEILHTRGHSSEGGSLISAGKPVVASHRGFRGPPTVITQEHTQDWDLDRWQASTDAMGHKITGEDIWIEIDLLEPIKVSKFLIDWEHAYAEQYEILGRLDENDTWQKMATIDAASGVHSAAKSSEKHQVHEFAVGKEWTRKHSTWYGVPSRRLWEFGCAAPNDSVRYVRIKVLEHGTSWGVSIWRWQVFGNVIPACHLKGSLK